ncbi:MAG: NAD(P)-dependent oxidoreductase [Anaerolineae bacterium]|nr:NAD(P)-dependent oxidoreductase [Anaerolineae bacterium]
MKRILITGAAGFIGRHTLPLFIDDDIHAISRQSQIQSDTVQWHQMDLLDRASVEQLMATVKPTHLLHFAWDVRPRLYWTSLQNYQWVSATLNLLHNFYENGGQRMVIAGTCAEYDWQYGYCVEDSTPLSMSTTYSACKSSLYRMAMTYAQETKMSLAWGRIFFPYGVYEHPSRLIPYVIQSMLKRELAQTSHGEQYRDFLYVADVASAFVALMNSDVQGAVNIGSGVPVKLKDIIYTIADILDARHLLEIGARQAANEPPMVVANVQRLSQDVAWTPRYSLSEGLAETIQWWQSQQS